MKNPNLPRTYGVARKPGTPQCTAFTPLNIRCKRGCVQGSEFCCFHIRNIPVPDKPDKTNGVCPDTPEWTWALGSRRCAHINTSRGSYGNQGKVCACRAMPNSEFCYKHIKDPKQSLPAIPYSRIRTVGKRRCNIKNKKTGLRCRRMATLPQKHCRFHQQTNKSKYQENGGRRGRLLEKLIEIALSDALIKRLPYDKDDIAYKAFNSAMEEIEAFKHIIRRVEAGATCNANMPRSHNTHGYVGVWLNKNPRYKNPKWVAQIDIKGKRYYLGSYPSAQEAAQARQTFIEKRLHSV